MRILQPKHATSRRARPRPHLTLLFILAFLAILQLVTAQNDNAAATTDDTTATATTDTDTKTTDSTATTTADTTTSSTSVGIPVVTVPPTDGAPYMQTSSTPEGAVFIAVGAVLGFLGLAVLAWRGLVAWSVNRSVRQSAMMQSSETKGLLRSSRRKRYGPRSKEYTFPSVSGRSGGGGGGGGGTSVPTTPPPPPPHGGNRSRSRSHRRSGSGSGSQKPLYIVPRSNNVLFYSPTAQSRRDSNPPPPPRTPPHHPSSAHYSYPYPPAQARHQHHGSGSSSSPGSGSGPRGQAPTEYLDGLFDNHTPPRRAQRQQRPPPDGYNRRRG